MENSVRFETPENVHIQYELAGLGTRFLAWFVDQILVMLFIILIFIFMTVVASMAAVTLDGLFEDWERDDGPVSPSMVIAIAMGIMLLIWGLGSFAYFGLSELFWHGQTIGKRVLNIRVVKSDGFALDPLSVLVRNMFRVADHIPVFWAVPVFSSQSQRTGDMVAGTVVVTDEPETLSEVRTELSQRKSLEAEFRFNQTSLKNLRPEDVTAIERILERWNDLDETQQGALLDKLVNPLAMRVGVEAPTEERRVRFLEDLLAAEFRRQNRALG